MLANCQRLYPKIKVVLSIVNIPVKVDLALLSLCSHTIMDYGTFGLWGGLFAGGEILAPTGYTRSVSKVESEENEVRNQENKHCQRHNGPRLLTLKLELSLQLNKMPIALVTNLTTRWRNLHSCKIVHQMAPLALVPNLATRYPH